MNRPALPNVVAWLVALALVATAGYFAFEGFRRPGARVPGEEPRVTQREAKGVKFKRPEDAKLRGIEATAVQAVSWQPSLGVTGRVVPNPDATLEMRAPFAGILRAEGDARLRQGQSVQADETLARLEARFTPVEMLDLQAKWIDAETRHKSAGEMLKIRQDRLTRLEKLPTGLLSQDDVDNASIQLAEARMQVNIAQTQSRLWKQAVDAVGKQSVFVPLQSSLAGEVVEVNVQPGANVEAGQLIARVIDFRRVLVRLEFPLDGMGEKTTVEVESLESPRRWRARLRGRAPSIEAGLQKASWLYEIVPQENTDPPRWQAGLFVKASVVDPTRSNQPALALPASALLVHQGRTLVYIEKRLGRYERREVEVLGREGDMVQVAPLGWLTSDRVVVHGAQVLLSEEFRSEMDED